jgi:hypothetical protein
MHNAAVRTGAQKTRSHPALIVESETNLPI